MKNMKQLISRSLLALAALVIMAGGVMTPLVSGHAAGKGDLMAVAKDRQSEPTLVLTLGTAEVLDIPDGVADVIVANPSIIDVVALQSNRLYIVGANFGTTNLLVTDAQGDILKRVLVHVKIDDIYLQELVSEFFPGEDVRIRSLQDQIIMTGHVSSPDIATKVQNFVMHAVTELQGVTGAPDDYIANLMTVGGDQQVMLRVRIMEVSRDILKEIGPSELGITDFGGVLGEGANLTLTRGIGGGLPTPAFGALGLTTTAGAFGPVNLILDALNEDGLSNVLAEPNLTAISGEQAGFLAGGEFPVPSGLDQNGNVLIEYRSFGVSLNFRPTVMSEDRISLQMDTEVSSLNRTDTVTIAGLDVPGLDVRRASTTVEMASGGTLMIAGLLQSEAVQSLAGLPGVKDAPVIGKLLSSDSFRRQETELVVMITPFLVKPYADDHFAVVAPEVKSNPLAVAFADNIKSIFGRRAEGLFVNQDRYGYLLD